MCVPPCEAGVYPRPPRPASRPECMRIKPTSPIESRTWMTASARIIGPQGTYRSTTSTIASINSAAIRSFVTYPAAPDLRARSTSEREFDPVSISTQVDGRSARIWRVAWKPSITGIAMSIRTTSGSIDRASSTASRPSRAWPATSIRSSVARIASRACANSRWSSAMRTRIDIGSFAAASDMPRRNMPCYGAFVKPGDARERIQKLLVTGDNRLKQGVDPAKARESYEQALTAAREAGLEDTIRPLVELRLADLERLRGEAPPPAPPGG